MLRNIGWMVSLHNASHGSEIENLQDYLRHFEHLGMGSANGRCHYNVMLFIIDWALNKNDSCDYGIWSVKIYSKLLTHCPLANMEVYLQYIFKLTLWIDILSTSWNRLVGGKCYRNTLRIKIQLLTQGAVSIRKTVLPGMAIPMLKIRRPNGRLIFNMEIAIHR